MRDSVGFLSAGRITGLLRGIRAAAAADPRWSVAAVLVVLVIAAGLSAPGSTGRADAQRAAAQAAGASSDVSRGDDVPPGTPDAPPPPPAEVVPPAPPPPEPPVKPWIPVGKGMWLNQFERANGGDPASIVERARMAGLTHIYVRVGSSKKGFYAQGDLNRILPVAHAAGIKVVGWDFAYLQHCDWDAERAVQEINYTTPDGHRIDAFAADIETGAEGTYLTVPAVQCYGERLRAMAPANYPLIAVVPRPSPVRWFPFAETVAYFDAIAPMVYWYNRDPVSDVVGAMDYFARFGKPVMPVGQAYDGAIDGANTGVPSRGDLERFIQASLDKGAVGVSFWVWHTATSDHWAAIANALQMEIGRLETDTNDPVRMTFLERVLNARGHPAPVNGVQDDSDRDALSRFQENRGLPVTGQPDKPTLRALLGPLHR